MKTIFRYTNLGLLVAAMMAMGAVASFAQDPCADADGQTAANDRITTLFKDKSIAGRKAYVAAGKEFIEKYGACESAKLLTDYLKPQLPKQEETIRKMEEQKVKDDLIARFNTGLTAKNWDEVFASGKELLQKYPDEFRDIEFVLGTIGFDELYNKNNSKYNDETLRFARQALANMDSGKMYKSYGIPTDFIYRSKENATGWMNLVVGYLTQVGQKNKSGAASALYKATQGPETGKNPLPYELIGYYYFDELDKLTTQIKTEADGQKPEDTPEVAQAKVDKIKGLVALANGTSERAIEAFAKAHSLGTAKAYKDKMRVNIENAYKLRFAKGTEGMDAFIAEAVKKPFQNPMTPVTPISDPEPVKADGGTASTGTGSGMGTANGTGIGAGNGTGVGRGNGTGVGTVTGTGTKPATTTVVNTKPTTTTTPAKKPGSKPVSTTKKVVKKRAA